MSEPINYDWEAAVAAWNKPERKKFDDFFTKPESPVGAIPPATTTNVSAYGNKALTEELATLANTNEGQRNDQLNRSAFNLAQLVARRPPTGDRNSGAVTRNRATHRSHTIGD